MDNKIDIHELTLAEIENFLIKNGEKKFRAKQIYEWLWKKGVGSIEEMTNLSLSLRQLLTQNFIINDITETTSVVSKDKTRKYLFTTIDGYNFESVLIPSLDRVTACISTQIGCQMACAFCATATLGFKRNLSRGEIFLQIFKLNQLAQKSFHTNLTNIVVMGMGEPLMNYENTIPAINMICSDSSLGMSPQRITLSTCGIPDQIRRLADDEIKFNLSISLHSAINDTRSKIMPINKRYNLNELAEAIKYFHAKTGKRITYEYLLLGSINDSTDDVRALTDFTRISPCKINLIDYNPHENDIFTKSTKEEKAKFIEHIEACNIVVTQRISKGDDIAAACGQLANKKKNISATNN